MDALVALRARADAVDEQVLALWEQWIAPKLRDKSCLVAVGGYGRRELFPYSDVDLLILEEPGTYPNGALSDFLRELWDCGLRASHSVHPVADCRKITPGNVEFNISLLDQRFLAGREDLYSACREACGRTTNELRKALAELTRARHERFQQSIHQLEPDLKEAPGGLRDLHVLGWLRKLGVDAHADLGEAAATLAQMRWHLHDFQGRDVNILRFEAQDAVAAALQVSPEDLMRAYYRAAKLVFANCREEVDRILDQRPGLRTVLFESRSRLSNEEFTVNRDQILLRQPARLETDPLLTHRLFAFQARHGLRLARDTRRRVAAKSNDGQAWRWQEWRAILEQPHAAAALRDMMDTGEMLRQLPEWARIDCLVTRDFYHRYTVDEHTVIALENLENFGATHRRLRQLFETCDQLPALRFALLLHDIGKGEGEDHDRKSVLIAQAVGARLGIPAAEQILVERLIADHLYLGQLTHTRDLDDPLTAEQAAQFMETREYLAMLTLLTFADSAAVFPGALTKWRESQLFHAYSVIERAFTRALEDRRIPEKEHSSQPELAAFLTGLPRRYWYRSTPEQRLAHFRLAEKARGSAVGLELQRREDTWQLTLVTQDRPRLLADIAGVLAAYGMNILKAEAFGNSQGVVLDLFVFNDPLHSLELNPPVVQELEEALARVASGKEKAEKLLRHRGRSAPRYQVEIAPVIRLDNEASEMGTLLELVASDRPGLLYDVARTIADCGCEIDTVLLATEGQRAVDVFYMRSGAAKVPVETLATLRKRLEEII
ncbi:MAG: hypothetical protein NW208_12015 [Bryobacter sp.]|nr:hypothetical protein [Bryobacter sp.]